MCRLLISWLWTLHSVPVICNFTSSYDTTQCILTGDMIKARYIEIRGITEVYCINSLKQELSRNIIVSCREIPRRFGSRSAVTARDLRFSRPRLWGVTQCILINKSQRFADICCTHLQRERVSRAKKNCQWKRVGRRRVGAAGEPL
jgi:hypothetical protein